MRKALKLLLLLNFFLLPPALAKVFQTDYLSFQLPADWACQQVHRNWMCEPTKASQRKFAIITVTAKEASITDRISNFQAHLSKPRSHQMGSKTPVMSQVLKTKRIKLSGHEWVQSIHMSSEVNDFMTMYLATVNKPLAVMVTLSAERTKWNQFKPVFDNILKTLSLKPYRLPVTKNGSSLADFGPQKMPSSANQQMATGIPLEDQSLSQIPKMYIYGLVLAGLALLAALYIFFKR